MTPTRRGQYVLNLSGTRGFHATSENVAARHPSGDIAEDLAYTFPPPDLFLSHGSLSLSYTEYPKRVPDARWGRTWTASLCRTHRVQERLRYLIQLVRVIRNAAQIVVMDARCHTERINNRFIGHTTACTGLSYTKVTSESNSPRGPRDGESPWP